MLRQGSDLTLIATGGMLAMAIDVAKDLASSGLQARVLSMHTVKPLDVGAVLAAARETPAIVTIEEHSIMGGLGSAVAEVLAEADGPKPRFRRIGLPPGFQSEAGSQEYLCRRSGLSPEQIVEEIRGLHSSLYRSA